MQAPSGLAELVGVEVSTLRRNFVAAFEKTPAGYHREVRLRKAASSLSRRMPVLQVAVEIGFESLSGFSDAFRKNSESARGTMKANRISFTIINSPLGELVLGVTNRGCCLVEFVGRGGARSNQDTDSPTI